MLDLPHHEPTQSRTTASFLDIATEAALAGGTVLESLWGKLEDIQEKGRSGDLVTEADKQSEAEALKVIHRHLPEHQILAEESGELGNADSEYLWAIDPRRYDKLRSRIAHRFNFCWFVD